MIVSGLHITGLVADSYVHFGPTELLAAPLASSWRPGVVALGVITLYLLLAVEGCSLLMRHIPRRWWRRIHLTSFIAFWLATFHLLLAGSDAGNVVAHWSANVIGVVVVFLSFVRALSAGTRADGTSQPAQSAGAEEPVTSTIVEWERTQAQPPPSPS